MDEHTRDILRPFADNETLFETVKKVVLDAFDLNEAYTNLAIDDAILGQNVRARRLASELANSAFLDIASCKTVPTKDKIINYR